MKLSIWDFLFSLGGDKRSSNINRRRMEDNLAMIFMGIVAVFLLCHFPRIFLGVHEMVIANEVLACGKLQQALRKTLIEVRQLHSTLGFAMGLTANLGICSDLG